MNRRAFIHSLGLGIATLGISTGVSKGLIEWVTGPEILRESAQAYLLRGWREYVRRNGHSPKYVTVGNDLFKQFESELMAMYRFCDKDIEEPGFTSLTFKGVKIITDGRSGFGYKFTNVLEWMANRYV